MRTIEKEWDIIGHSQIFSFLKRSISQRKLAHSYLFSGPSHVGKKTMALQFAHLLLQSVPSQKTSFNNHPDLSIIHPVKQIGISDIRDVKKFMTLTPHTAHVKVCIILQADKMTEEAGNALLKLLEEPPKGSFFILISSQVSKIMKTILSRCLILPFSYVPRRELELSLIQHRKMKLSDFQEMYPFFMGRPGLYLQDHRDSLYQLFSKSFSIFERLHRASIFEKLELAERLQKMSQHLPIIFDHWIMIIRDVYIMKKYTKNLVFHKHRINDIKKIALLYNVPFSKQGLSKLFRLLRIIHETSTLLGKKSSGQNKKLALENLVLSF